MSSRSSLIGVLRNSHDLLAPNQPTAELYVHETRPKDTVVSGLMGLVAAETLTFLSLHGAAALVVAAAVVLLAPAAAWALSGPRALWLADGTLTSLSVWQRVDMDLDRVTSIAREQGLRIDPLRFRDSARVLTIHNLSDETEELRLAVGQRLVARGRAHVAERRARAVLGLPAA